LFDLSSLKTRWLLNIHRGK